MTWIIVSIAVVVVLALAWWSSGRARPGATDRQRRVDVGSAEAKSRSQINQSYGGNGPFSL